MDEYLIFEPLDEDDEFYDEQCEAAWTAMWSSGMNYNV